MKINTLGWISFILSIAFILYFINDQKKYTEIKSNGKWVVGTITTYGSDVLCFFNINGVEKIKKESSPYALIVSGEKYKVYYNEKFPNKFLISFSEPIIDTSFSKVLSTKIKLRYGHIEFHYKVNGNDYKRFQYAIDSIKINPKLKYNVMYNPNNPQMAYLIYN